MKPTMYTAITALLFLCHCARESQEETQLRQLFRQEKDLTCQLATMKDSITTEWDEINRLLEAHMPAEMTAEERANMLKVRNANLIRMFQSFDQMGDTVKTALSHTEAIDQQMTQRILLLKQQTQDIEAEKMALLQEVSQQDGNAAVARLQSLQQAILSEDCR